ncbi:MAG: NAD(P)-dependent oxidoreductase [Hydrotalea sp.]|nr:NAD(P)-dependent oxidoreductase [Hydrotalea sp.]
MTTVAFLGLGIMGGNMARHVAVKGNAAGITALNIYNRTPDKANNLAKSVAAEVSNCTITIATDVASAVKNADIVLACLGNDSSVRAITQVAFPAMKSGALFVDHTTASASLAKDLYATAKTKNLFFLDAPVSGGQAGAEKGILSIMVGGDEDVFNRAQPVMACYGKIIERIGDSGAGQLAKMVNQIAIAGLLQGLSEAIFLGEQSGIDMTKVLKVISGGAAQSWQMENRGATMLERKFDFGFQVKWMVKDLLICLAEAKNLNIELPITKQVEQFYEEIKSSGGETFDTSALITRLK